MCEEYDGPTRKYSKLGMEELHLKTVDHFEPSLEDLQVSFILPNVEHCTFLKYIARLSI